MDEATLESRGASLREAIRALTLIVAPHKGGGDRYVVLSPPLLEILRGYWRLTRPAQWLFPRRDRSGSYGPAGASRRVSCGLRGPGHREAGARCQASYPRRARATAPPNPLSPLSQNCAKNCQVVLPSV